MLRNFVMQCFISTAFTFTLKYAFLVSAQAEGILDEEVSAEQLEDKLLEEVHSNWAFYKEFSHEDQDILTDINLYVRQNIFNTDTGDLVISVLRNAYAVDSHIYMYRNGRLICINEGPRDGRSIGAVRLTLTGSNASSHYNAVINSASPTEQDPLIDSPIPSSARTLSIMSPEIIKPFPKAAALKNPTRRQRKRKAAILTDTPEKDAIGEEDRRRNNRQNQRKYSAADNPKRQERKETKHPEKTMVTKKQMRKRMRGVWCALSLLQQ